VSAPLSKDADRLLGEVIASAHGPVPIAQLLTVVDGDPDRLDRALAELDERGLVRALGSLLTRDAHVAATDRARRAGPGAAGSRT
jgi:hypothetical protein